MAKYGIVHVLTGEPVYLEFHDESPRTPSFSQELENWTRNSETPDNSVDCCLYGFFLNSKKNNNKLTFLVASSNKNILNGIIQTRDFKEQIGIDTTNSGDYEAYAELLAKNENLLPTPEEFALVELSPDVKSLEAVFQDLRHGPSK